jgi:hypothetical protein
MTANQIANPALFAIPGGLRQYTDPVKARVAAPRQITHFEELQASTAPTPETHRGLHLLPEAVRGNRRRPHPGDVLYWVACLGGVCLLLLSATT